MHWPGLGAAPAQAVLRDGANARVGVVVGFSAGPSVPDVLVSGGGRLFQLRVGGGAQLAGTQGGLLFSTADCTGTAYLLPSLPPPPPGLSLALTRDASPGPIVWATEPGGGTPQDVAIDSALSFGNAPCSQNTNSGVLTVVVATEIPLDFVPPFRVGLE